MASIQAANKKGVLVVQYNGKANGGKYVTFVGSLQSGLWVLLGKYFEKLYKDTGKPGSVASISATAGQITDIARNDGLKTTSPSRPHRDK